MQFEGWMVSVVVVVLFALVMVVVLLPRVCSSLCQKLEKCGERGNWPCRS